MTPAAGGRRGWMRALSDGAFQTLFRAGSLGGDLGQALVYRCYFGWTYRRPDPWNYVSNPYDRAKYERTLALLRGTCAPRALEAGCAEGVFTELLLREGLVGTIVGADVSPAALARARARCADLPGATFVRANVASTAPPGPFDLVLCCEVLYYLGPRARRACGLLSSRLAPGGRLVAVHPAGGADALHAPWLLDPCLAHEHRERGSEERRPYIIDVFRRIR